MSDVQIEEQEASDNGVSSVDRLEKDTILIMYKTLETENKRLLIASAAKDGLIDAGLQREKQAHNVIVKTEGEHHKLLKKHYTMMKEQTTQLQDHLKLLDDYNDLDVENTKLKAEVAAGVCRELTKSDAIIAVQRRELAVIEELRILKRRRSAD